MTRFNNQHNRNTLADQVRLLAPQVKTRQAQLPRTSDIGRDGVHHINVWEEGETILGRALSHMAKLPFTHSTLGPFESIEGLWYYVQAETPDETLRTKSGFQALSAGRKVKTRPVADFRIIIANANWEKVNAYPDIMQMVMDCNLHFEKYYYKVEPATAHKAEQQSRQRTVNSPWIIGMFDEIRYALINNKQPDFDFLSDAEQQRIQTSFRAQGSNVDLFSQFKSNQAKPVFPTAKPVQEKQFNKPVKQKKWPKKERVLGSEVDETQSYQVGQFGAVASAGVQVVSDLLPVNEEAAKVALVADLQSRSDQLDELANFQGTAIAVDVATGPDSTAEVSYEDIKKAAADNSPKLADDGTPVSYHAPEAGVTETSGDNYETQEDVVNTGEPAQCFN